MEKTFGYYYYKTCRHQNLSSHGTVMYNFVVPNLDDEYELQSVLYKPPYGECKCGYENEWGGVVNDVEIFKRKRGRREDVMKLKNIIKEEKYKKLYPYVYVLAPKLPMDPYKNKTDIACFEEQASEINKQIDWINVREPVNQFEMAMFEHADIHSLQSELALPVDDVRSFIWEPEELQAPPRDDPEPDPARGNISEDSDEDDLYEVDFNEQKNWVSFVDTNVLVDELLDELTNGENELDDVNEEENVVNGEDEVRNGEDNVINGEEDVRNGEENVKNGEEDVRNGEKNVKNAENILNGRSYTPPPDDDADNGQVKNEKSPKKENGALDANRKNDKVNGFHEDSNAKGAKCIRCGVEIKKADTDDDNEDSICKKCADNDKEQQANGVNKTIRFKLIRERDEDDADRRHEEDGENNLPSTSKNEIDDPVPSTSNSNKRFHENNSNSERSDAKKFKSNNENTPPPRNNPDYDLNISCDVEDVNIRVSTPSMFFIDLHEPEQSVMNVPMGGGLINILLGADGKTKTAIRKLSLRGYQKINDSSLEYLKTLKLDLLDVTRTSVSRGAVLRFIRQNPTCRVLHESACTCLPNMYF
ncbi:hypothetical protein Trydic_g23567 [Trypoxylus dichotomus]